MHDFKVGIRIKELRNELSMTYREFGERINVSPSTICNYESLKRMVPHRVVSDISDKFFVNREWLCYGTGEMYIDRGISEISEKIHTLISCKDKSVLDAINNILTLSDNDIKKVSAFIDILNE